MCVCHLFPRCRLCPVSVPSLSRLCPVSVPSLSPFHSKGGSWISTGDEASRFCRFAFRRHFFQHMGFRLARSSSPTPLRLCTTEVFVLGVGVSGKNQIFQSCVKPEEDIIMCRLRLTHLKSSIISTCLHLHVKLCCLRYLKSKSQLESS